MAGIEYSIFTSSLSGFGKPLWKRLMGYGGGPEASPFKNPPMRIFKQAFGYLKLVR
jgi:hypothetical protein